MTLSLLFYSLWAQAWAAADIQIQLVDKKGKAVADAFVELIAKDGSNRATPTSLIIDQIDKEFKPMISAAPVGSTIQFPNSDNIQHQIYSFSKTKKFDLPLFSKNESKKVVFSTAGIVNMGCNIHDWMLAYLYVYESRFLQQSSASGIATFSNLPAGAYELRIWSPRLRNTQQAIQADLQLQDGSNSTSQQQLNVRKKIRKKPRIEDDEY